jgi:adenine-specific DNA-methyltransferase
MNADSKIVAPYRAPGNRFAVDERRALNDGGDVRMIFAGRETPIDLYFLTAVLNSKMMERYFRHIGRRKGEMLEYFKDSLKVLPIRTISPSHPIHSSIAELSRQQHEHFSEQKDYLVERMILDLYELKATATAPGMLF